MENRGVWGWMEKERRTTKNWRVGMGSSWGHRDVAGPAAHFQRLPRMHGFLCLPPPTPRRYGLRKGPLGLVSVLGRGSGVSDASTRSGS